MFNKLNSNVFNTVDGFRNMSLERDDLYNYSIYERDSVSGKIAASPIVSEINNFTAEGTYRTFVFRGAGHE